MIFTKLIIIKNSMFSNIMYCESKTKSKLTAYPTLQAKSFITQIFFFFKVMFLREIYNYIRFMCSNIHSSILSIYNLTKKKRLI